MKRLLISFSQIYLEPGAAYGFSHRLISELRKRISRKSLPSEKFHMKYPGAERLDFSLSASSKIKEGHVRGTEYHRSSKEVECALTLTFSANDRSWKRRSATGIKNLVSCVATVFANFELEVPASWNKSEILEFYLQDPERCVDPYGRSLARPTRLSDKSAAKPVTPKNWDKPTNNADDEHDPFNNPRQRSKRSCELMTEEYFWDCVDEDSPFGSDEGWDAYYEFRDWRRENPKARIRTYINTIMLGRASGYNKTLTSDDAIIESVRNPRKSFLGNEFDKGVLDVTIIAICLTQLIDEGHIEPAIKSFAEIAIARQRHKAFRPSKNRLKILNEIERVLREA